MTGSVIALGVQLAMPIVVTFAFDGFIFGLINRVAPQVNVWFFWSLPVKMWLGLFVVAIMLPFLISRMMDYFNDSYEAFEYMIQQFRQSITEEREKGEKGKGKVILEKLSPFSPYLKVPATRAIICVG